MTDNEGLNYQKLIIYLLVGAGVFLRLFHFFDNRSLWLDELYLAINIVERNLSALASPSLEYQQKAPIGFLWTVKILALMFGNKEMALRLFPLISGVLSLFVFIPVARYWLKPAGAIAAIGILALAPPLVYHSVEIKQYSTELFATVLCLFLYVRYHKKQDLMSMALWAIYGAVILWFSFSSIFILSGIAIGSSLYYLYKKDWVTFGYSLIPFGAWLISFVLNYLLFTIKHADQEWLLHWFRHYNSFMPLPPKSLADLIWFFKSFYTLLDYPLGLLWNFNSAENTALRVVLKMSFIPIVLSLFGVLSFIKTDRKSLMVIIFPLLLTLLASGLELYPFFERLVVFLSPLLILLIARGCDRLTYAFSGYRNWRYVFCVLLLIGPLVSSSKELLNPALFGRYKKSYQREALSYVDRNYKQGDVVYIYWNIQYAYEYYKETYNLRFDGILGSDVKFISRNEQDYIRNLGKDISLLEGRKRVWVIYSKELWNDIGEEEGEPKFYQQSVPGQLLYEDLLKKGANIDTYNTREVNVHLLDLSKGSFKK